VQTVNTTLNEIDEALNHAKQIPPNERGTAWHAYTDRLLEMRAATEKHGGTTTRTTHTGNTTPGTKGAQHGAH